MGHAANDPKNSFLIFPAPVSTDATLKLIKTYASYEVIIYVSMLWAICLSGFHLLRSSTVTYLMFDVYQHFFLMQLFYWSDKLFIFKDLLIFDAFVYCVTALWQVLIWTLRMTSIAYYGKHSKSILIKFWNPQIICVIGGGAESISECICDIIKMLTFSHHVSHFYGF